MSPISEGYLTAGEVVSATKGQLIGGDCGRKLGGVSTDTRTIGRDELFVALEGSRFDGHEFLTQALEKGAGALVGRRGSLNSVRQGCSTPPALIEVDDTLFALGELARHWRQGHPVPLLAITGSNGKTTTKEMVASILSQTRAVLKTEGNLNNRIGLPLSLFRLRVQHQVAVLEMGMNEPGEIERLCEIAQPQYGLITQVAPVHVEGLGSVAAIAQEKGALFDALKEADTAIVNLDDPWVIRLSQRCRAHWVTFGQGEAASVRFTQTDPFHPQGVRGILKIMGEDCPVQMRCYGGPCLQNALAAAAAAVAMGASSNEVVKGLESFRAFPRRLNVISLREGIHIIDDTYNANPVSMDAALELLQHLAQGRSLAVLGDMRELGPRASSMHRATGKRAADVGVDILIAVGELSEDMIRGAEESELPPQEMHACASAQQALDLVLSRCAEGDWVLVKGSRAVALERVVDGIRDSFREGDTLQSRNVG